MPHWIRLQIFSTALPVGSEMSSRTVSRSHSRTFLKEHSTTLLWSFTARKSRFRLAGKKIQPRALLIRLLSLNASVDTLGQKFSLKFTYSVVLSQRASFMCFCNPMLFFICTVPSQNNCLLLSFVRPVQSYFDTLILGWLALVTLYLPWNMSVARLQICIEYKST